MSTLSMHPRAIRSGVAAEPRRGAGPQAHPPRGREPFPRRCRPACAAPVVFALALFALPVFVRAETPGAAVCRQVKGSVQCDRAAFVKTLAAAHSVALQTQPFDRNGQRELGELAAQLGKTVSAANADLLFRLVRLDPANPVYYGPNNRVLAALRVYLPGVQGGRGPLLWIENYAGQPDTPWPTVVHQIIRQFKADAR